MNVEFKRRTRVTLIPTIIVDYVSRDVWDVSIDFLCWRIMFTRDNVVSYMKQHDICTKCIEYETLFSIYDN